MNKILNDHALRLFVSLKVVLPPFFIVCWDLKSLHWET